MIRPTRRFLLLAASGLPITALAAIGEERLWPAPAVFLSLAALAFVTDALLAPRRGKVVAGVTAPTAIPIGAAGEVELLLRASPPAEIEALLEVDDLVERPSPVRVGAGRDGARASVSLTPKRRGKARLSAAWLRWSGPIGLAERRKVVAIEGDIPIVPDVRPVKAAALDWLERRDLPVGARVRRFAGEGTEFDALREYLPGLDHRRMSWKASARHRRLLCQELRAERDQRVVLAFDCGRLMGEPLDGVARLDHAVNSGLLLAWSSLRVGDRAGMYAFGSRPGAFFEPEAGLGTFAKLKAWAADLEYDPAESNYTLALAWLAARLPRRSLVVLFTDFVDVVLARLMLESLSRLSTRHLVLFVSLTDPLPRDLADRPPESAGDVRRAVVARELMRERELVLLRIRRMGIHVLDVEPARLSPSLVERYLEIKRRELI